MLELFEGDPTIKKYFKDPDQRDEFKQSRRF